MMTLNQEQLEYCRRLIHESAGISLDKRKDYLFETRLQRLAEMLGLGSTVELVARLQAPGAATLKEQVVDAMTTNETSFFRDTHPFDSMREQILPRLLAARAPQRRLSIWCAACSTGQEPYSLAMLLLDAAPELANWKFEILATDLSERVLVQAREGVYSDVQVGRGMPDAMRERFFERDGRQWRVKDDVRRRIEFRQMNLNAAWPPIASMDVVFLRNVLIYFDVESKARILGNVRRLLAPDGLLCLGAAETVLGIRDDYRPVRLGRATFYEPCEPRGA